MKVELRQISPAPRGANIVLGDWIERVYNRQTCHWLTV